MRTATLVLRQLGYEFKAFYRNPVSAFFTFAFPLLFLVIFNLIFGNFEMDRGGGTMTMSNFYVPAIAAFSVINACFTSLAINIAYSRDQGLLKRVRGTPMPTWIFLTAKLAHSVLLSLALVVVVTAAGVFFYGVDVPGTTLPAFLVSLAVGAAVFSALGFAITAAIPNADASPAVVNAVILPLLFISDVFIPMGQAPDWLKVFADVFPVKHLATSLITAFNPFETGSGFEWDRLGVMAAWGVAAVVVAVRYFSWEPRR